MPLFVMGRETIRQLRSVRNGTHPYNGTQSPKTTHLKHTRAAVNSAKNRSMTLTEVWDKWHTPSQWHTPFQWRTEPKNNAPEAHQCRGEQRKEQEHDADRGVG